MATLTLKEHIHTGAYCGLANQLYIYTLNVFGLALTGILMQIMPGDAHLLSFSFLGCVALRKLSKLSKQICSVCVISRLIPVWILPLFLKSRTEHSASRELLCVGRVNVGNI